MHRVSAQQRWRRRLVALLAACCALPSAAAATAVQDIRFGRHDATTRVVLDLSERNGYRIFTLAEPDRLVIDLPQARWNVASRASADRAAPGGGVVDGYRQARYRADMHRVVLELARPVKVAEAFQIDRRGSETGDGSRLVVDLAPISRQAYRQRGSRVIEAKPGATSATGDSGGQAQSADGVPVPARNPRRNDRRVIVVDAGHGGRDPGAIGHSGTYEKAVTLRAAKLLRRELQQRKSYAVVLTRETDRFLTLRRRVEIARQHNGDLFISLHADAHPESEVRGASFYTLSETASDDVAARLARSENRGAAMAGMGVDVNNQQVASILIDLVQRSTMNGSRRFATQLVSSLDSRIPVLDNPKRSAAFVVLKAPDVPSVLVEMGFLSNPRDERLLRRDSHLRKIVDGIAGAVDSYFAEQPQLAGRAE